jgi:hypothetical protein
MLSTTGDSSESAKTLVSRLVIRHSQNGCWRQKYIASPKTIESEVIEMPRATFGGPKMINNANFQNQFE